MIIQHNMLAMNNLMVGKQLQKAKIKNMERLSSGYRINRAADDAANMAISEKMTSRIRALARCQQNIEEGISLAQTTDGALNEVNNMLNRVNELCVQAANGTNTAEDRSKIAEEITQIYDEMDRIFETTEFNTMKIFRHDGDNYYGPEAEYLYHESVTETPGELHNWGAAMFPTKQFDLAKPATAATATLTLADGVDLNDVNTLNGTSFNINKNGTIYKIEFGTSRNTGASNNTMYIKTSDYRTLQGALNSITSYYPYRDFIDKVEVNGNQVNFSFVMPQEDKTIIFNADTDGDGNRETITATETLENGAKNNNISIYCEGNQLNPVGFIDSQIKYNDTATATFTILNTLGKDDPLPGNPASFLANLRNNELLLFGYAKELDLNSLPTSSINTVADLSRAIASLIEAEPNYSAVYDESNNHITVTLTGMKTQTNELGYLYETTNTSGTATYQSTVPIQVSLQSSSPSGESLTTHSFSMPVFESDKFYTVKIKDQHYLIYDSSYYPNFSVDDTDSSTTYYIRSASSAADMKATFISLLKSKYDDFDISTDSTNTVTMTSKNLNNTTSIVIEGGLPDTQAKLTPVSQKVLDIGLEYYKREYSIELDFSSIMNNGFDSSLLNGKGFILNNTYYQFKDSNNNYSLYNDKTVWIDLSGADEYEDLRYALETAVKKNNSTMSVTSDNFGNFHLVDTVETNTSGNSSTNFSDGGPSGTFSNSAISSGGTAYKNPQAEIDFSKYDMDNLDDLYGTGFRLTCATCPGEFVNVMFCHDKSELNYPDSFEYTDENGNTNTIHNYMVELKDVTDGSQIASYIAEQLERDLDHFTEVKVSDTNPAVLIAQDKRSKDQTGRGQVLAGVYTNFLYNVLPEKLPNLGDKVGGGRKDTEAYYAYCMIYAGDTKDKPYIPVHLPHFSVENLKLEYPGEPWDTYEKITDVMNRSKNAAEVVSMARSKIGADQNRLEHAFDYAANAEEQITDAMSRIKDTDMAEAVTTQAKLTILSNTQEAMLSQIADLPERILPLLQQ